MKPTKIPKISRILGITFFFLALVVIGYITFSSYLYCNSIGNKEMCGFEVVLVNLPMNELFSPYDHVFLSVPAGLAVLVLLSSLFWAFIGVCIGLLISLFGVAIRQIRYGSHSVRFAYLIGIIILAFILFRFFAIHFLI